MARTQDMIKKFQKMSPQELKVMTNRQAKTLLAIIHAKLHTNPSQRQQTKLPKKKTIRRFSSKSAYKTYVRANICKITQKSLRNICKKREPCLGGKIDDQESEERGSSNLKYSSKQEHHSKKINLRRNITQALTSSNLEELCCSICLQLLICPTLTICGHVFCYQCLDESLLFSHNCPNCRENIKGSELIRCVALDNIIQKKYELSPQEHLMSHNDYDQRRKKFKDWQLRRILNVQEIYVGQVIDVRDTETIWCQGTITKIYKRYDRQLSRQVVSSILMHYNRWHTLYNEIIQIPTNRIAPLNYFSSRIDIPRYNLSEMDNNMRGTVVSGVRMEQPNTIQIMESDDEDFDDDELLVDVDGDENANDEEEENEEIDQQRDRQLLNLFNNITGERQQNNGFVGNTLIPTFIPNNRRAIFNRDRTWHPIRPRYFEVRRPQQQNPEEESLELPRFSIDFLNFLQNNRQEEIQSLSEQSQQISRQISEQPPQQNSDWFENVSMRNFSSSSERKQNSVVEIKDSEDQSRQVLVEQDVEIMMVDDVEDMVDDLDEIEGRMTIE